MDNVIIKTKQLIEVIENSDLIRNLDHYKNKVVFNKEIMNLINEYNSSEDNYKKISIKEKIYSYEDYNLYMKYYNELFYYVLKVNSKFKLYTDVRGCSNESH